MQVPMPAFATNHGEESFSSPRLVLDAGGIIAGSQGSTELCEGDPWCGIPFIGTRQECQQRSLISPNHAGGRAFYAEVAGSLLSRCYAMNRAAGTPPECKNSCNNDQGSFDPWLPAEMPPASHTSGSSTRIMQ